jgi:enoyl-CoA hydratase/carnithine racemase
MKIPLHKLVAATVGAIAFGLCGISSSNAATDDGAMVFETLRVRKEGAVLFAEIAAPPMNLLGPELVRDLVSLIQRAEADDSIHVLVFKSADPDYFISHVDVTRIKEYREEAASSCWRATCALPRANRRSSVSPSLGWV